SPLMQWASPPQNFPSGLRKRGHGALQVVVDGDVGIHSTGLQNLLDKFIGSKESGFTAAALDRPGYGDNRSKAHGSKERNLLHIYKDTGLTSREHIHFQVDRLGALDIQAAIEDNLGDT